MPEAARRPLGRGRTAAIGRPGAGAVRTDEAPRERPQWQGLFREPDLPPYDEPEGDDDA